MSATSKNAIVTLARGLGEPVVLMTGATLTIGYGTLYYAYGVLAPAIAGEFGVGIDWFFAAFTLGLLASGIAAPLVGRRLDRHGARLVATVGSVAAAVSLAVCAASGDLWMFVVGVVLAEFASCMVLYEAVFAGFAQLFGHAARRRMTAVTLIAGFASTIFWPLTQWLLSEFGWRQTFLIFAATHLCVCAPLYWRALRDTGPKTATDEGEADAPGGVPVFEGAERRAALALYTVAVCVSGIVYAAFPVHMLLILRGEGFTADAAALIAMAMGPAQVAARLAEIMAGHRFDALTTGRVALLALAGAIAALVLFDASTGAAIVFAALYGASQGLMTIARGTVPLQLFGPVGYATLVGKITGLRMVVNAGAPYLFAVSTTHLGHAIAMLACLFVTLVALVTFWLLRPPRGSSVAPP